MYIGIDLGGTNIAAGLVDNNGKILMKASVPTNSERPMDEIVKDMAQLVDRIIKQADLKEEDIKAIGIGCPGTIDPTKGEIVYSNNIALSHYMLSDEFKKYTDIPIKVDNDANCAALGEYIALGMDCSCFVFITLGTGVGGGIVLNGKVFHGFNGAASEAGHITIVSGGKKCTCGKEGCWEAYASATALIEQTEEAMEKAPQSLMHEVAKKEGRVSGRTAFDAAKQGDEAAQRVVDQYIRYLSDGLVSVENMLQPDIIAVGGGISHEGDYLMNPVRKYVSANGFNKYMQKTSIVTAKLLNDAGIVGAALM